MPLNVDSTPSDNLPPRRRRRAASRPAGPPGGTAAAEAPVTEAPAAEAPAAPVTAAGRTVARLVGLLVLQVGGLGLGLLLGLRLDDRLGR
ncbi:hypothetical protein, partial [Streptomyces sp. WAC06614]|uniref:hypothetical protein n=1 Tax=Streptomyces sp. WAC06614 TaxID=2487416 RepID=UPI00163C2ECE